MRQWLKDAREAIGKTQAQMASELGITESYYHYIEVGERQKDMDLSLVAKLALALELSVEQVCKFEGV